jgi:ParB/RepB/Spo0J family partition protein
MEYQRIDLDRVLQGGPEAELYVFTYRTDRTELQTSIEKSGLLVPPVLKEHDEKTYQVVCGSRRIKILRRLGWQSVDAFVVSSREWTDVECLSRSILENLLHRGFNDVEKALLFTRLRDRFFHLLPRLADTLGEDLKMPGKERTLESYRFVLSLSSTALPRAVFPSDKPCSSNRSLPIPD